MITKLILAPLARAHARVNEFNLGSTAATKTLGLALGLVANLSAVALLSHRFGVEGYAAYALISSLLFLLPFADLGLGAGVINAVSDARAGKITQTAASFVIARSRAMLIAVGLLMSILTVNGWATGILPGLLGSLGSSDSISLAAAIAIVIFSLTLPFSLGSRILQGMGKVSLNVRLGLINPLCNLVLLVLFYFVNAPLQFYLLAPSISYALVNIATHFIATKRLNAPKLGLMDIWSGSSGAKIPLLKTATPFFVISVGMAVGFQSHRVAIAHLGTVEDVATYSLIAQFAGPISALITTIGQNLWSGYRSDRSKKPTTGRFFGDVLLFATIGAMGAIVLVFGVFVGERFLTNGEVGVTWCPVIAAGFYILVTAVHQPGAMFLTSPGGLARQAVMVLAVSAVSVFSIVLTYPVLAVASTYAMYALSMIVLQVGPTWLLIRRQLPRSADFEGQRGTVL